MREEQVTKNILDWLEKNNWKIVCYDFPQSGTGILLHLNTELRITKNKGAIIPDIVAVKDNIAIFFENKDRFVQSDFNKINNLRINNQYSESIKNLLKKFPITDIYYGIAIPHNNKQLIKAQENLNNVDFLISSSLDKDIAVIYDQQHIFNEIL